MKTNEMIIGPLARSNLRYSRQQQALSTEFLRLDFLKST